MPRRPRSTMDGSGMRIPSAGLTWHEVFLDIPEAGKSTLDEAVAGNHSILVVNGLASAAECQSIRSFAADAMQRLNEVKRSTSDMTRQFAGDVGRCRMPVCDNFDSDGQALCNLFLLRAVAHLREEHPVLLANLFGTTLTAAPLCNGNNHVVFSYGEPAVNVYTAGGQFEPHEDLQSLTVLLNVTGSGAFEGGGTAFWSMLNSGAASEEDAAEVVEPSFVLRPMEGTALLFCGRVTHSGQPVRTGERVVFVASLSPMLSPGACVMNTASGMAGLF